MQAPELSPQEDDFELEDLLQEIADLRSASPTTKSSTLNADSPSWKPFGPGGLPGSSPMYIDFNGLKTKVDDDLVDLKPEGLPWQVPILGVGPPSLPPGFGVIDYLPDLPLTGLTDLSQMVGEACSTDPPNSSTSASEEDSLRTTSLSTGAEPENHDSASDENERPAGEDPDLFRTLRLRGLPYRSREDDVRHFLGPHLSKVAQDGQAVRFITNSDGRPSGFATVRFVTHAAAKAALRDLHNKMLGNRYIEVFGLRERHSRQRHAEDGRGLSAGSRTRDATLEPQREQAVRECVAFMSVPERNQVLLSMLGVALSDASRAFLKRHALGLKSFLAELEDVFRIEGPKGAERVIFLGTDGSLNDSPLLTNMGTPLPPPGLSDSPSWSAEEGTPSMRLELFPLVGSSLGQEPLGLDPSAEEYNPDWAGGTSPAMDQLLEEAAQAPQWSWGPPGFPIAQGDDLSAGCDGYNSQWSLGSPAVGCF